MTPTEVGLLMSILTGVCSFLGTMLGVGKKISKLDKIDTIEEKIDDVSETINRHFVSIEILNEKVKQMEREIKDIKRVITSLQGGK